MKVFSEVTQVASGEPGLEPRHMKLTQGGLSLKLSQCRFYGFIDLESKEQELPHLFLKILFL